MAAVKNLSELLSS